MEYFEILNLKREPFSNSPDPEFFFQSRQHVDCLQKLEIAVRLRRGLNVVVGEVGTGKTTLCRQFIRRLGSDTGIESHLILDPQFPNAMDFLQTVAGMFEGDADAIQERNETRLKERIKQTLFRKGVDEGKTIVLLIDEGQKIPAACLELLREFLNFETNDYKLLQIVIFAQQEFEVMARTHANFTDRINLYHRLGPLPFRDTRRLIHFRLQQSTEGTDINRLFTVPGMWAIYHSTGGYPRKIINLCHSCILTMIIQNRTEAGFWLVRSCIRRMFPEKRRQFRMLKMMMAGALLFSLAILLADDDRRFDLFNRMERIVAASHGARSIVAIASDGDRVPDDRSLAAPPGSTMPSPIVTPGKGIETVSEPARSEIKRQDLENEGDEVADIGSPARKTPWVLGRAAMKKGESLSQLIQVIYGEFNNGYLAAVLQANPFIRRVEAIEAGRTIHFPAIPTSVGSTDMQCWWIQLDEQAELSEALEQIREYHDQGIPVRLIPRYHPDAGLRFVIVMKGYFFEESEFQKRLAEIPQAISSKARRVRSWGDDQTVLYADPYVM